MKVYIRAEASGPGVENGANGIEAIGNVLASMAARGERLRPIMGKIGTILIGSVHENFAVEGRPKWKPRSEKTIHSMEQQAVQRLRQTKKWQNAKRSTTRAKYEEEAMEKVRGNKLLQRTGDLRKSIMLGKVTDQSVEIGSSLKYARIHQLGGTIPRMTIKPKNKKALLIPTNDGVIFRRSANLPERKIPARPYLGVQDEDIPVIAEAVRLFVVGGEH
jgi:phage gpG-like protein